MYLEHFGLASNPFGLSPRLDYLYRSETFEESMAHLVYGLDSNEALVLITGPIGTGKTMAVQSFLSNLGPGFATALVTNTQVTAAELLKLVLEDLEVPYPRPADKSDLLIAFKNFLIGAGRAGRRVIIVIDEAQNLGPSVLEEVRLLTNLGQGESQVVQLVLVGQPELEAIVEQPDLAQLRQRIRVHYRLAPLTRSEVEEYVAHRLAVAGCTDRVFAKEALDDVFRLSRGIPRLVNALAGAALLSAFVAGRRRVVREDIDEAEIPAHQDSVTVPPSGRAVESVAEVVPPVAPPAIAPAVPPPQAAPVGTARKPLVTGIVAEESPAETSTRGKRPTREFGTRREPSGRRLGPWFLGVVLTLALILVWLFQMNGLDSIAKWTSSNGSGGEPGRGGSLPVSADTGHSVGPSAAVAAPEETGTSAVSGPDSITAPVETPAAELSSGFAVHIGSFRTVDRAETFVGKLAAAGVPSFSREAMVGRQIWYRVYVGLYPDRPTARAAIEDLRESFVLQYTMITRMDLADTH